MTSQQRFERDLPDLLADLYVGGIPDYRDDLLRATAGTRQRPAWTFPTRWIPMDLTMRQVPALRLAWRALAVALLVLALVAAAVYVGSQRRVPPPFGPARNGSIAYSSGGDIYVRTTFDAQPRLLIGGAGDDAFATFSPDGTRMLYSTTVGRNEYLKVAGADGSRPIQVFDDPIEEAGAVWAPNGASIALITKHLGISSLFIVRADGSGASQVDLGVLVPFEVVWRPPTGDTLLVRASGPDGVMDLYTMRPDGSAVRALGVPSDQLFGAGLDLGGSTFSPDGSTIAYNSVDRNPATGASRFRVHLMNADGTNDRPVAGPAADLIQEAWPAFSPDGKSLLVHRWTWSRDSGGTDAGLGWVAILPADGSVAGRDVGPKIAGGEHTGLIKTWSPDSTRILVRTDTTHAVYAIDPASGRDEVLPWAGFDLPDIERLAP
jgi:Tol biopolymer transport system component